MSTSAYSVKVVNRTEMSLMEGTPLALQLQDGIGQIDQKLNLFATGHRHPEMSMKYFQKLMA